MTNTNVIELAQVREAKINSMRAISMQRAATLHILSEEVARVRRVVGAAQTELQYFIEAQTIAMPTKPYDEIGRAAYAMTKVMLLLKYAEDKLEGAALSQEIAAELGASLGTLDLPDFT